MSSISTPSAATDLKLGVDPLGGAGLFDGSLCFGVDYNAIIPFKHHLLEKAWINFTKTGSKELRVAFEKFCHEQAYWLEDYVLFRALKIRYNGAYYLEWPRELVQRVPKVLAQARNDLVNQIDQVCFGQFLLFRQGERLQKHARAEGLRLIGDLPFFCFSGLERRLGQPGVILTRRPTEAALPGGRST